MIITDKFVFVHLPKTGGTFVESVLQRIHSARGDQIIEQRADEMTDKWLNQRLRAMIQPLVRRSQPGLYLKLTHRQGNEYNQHGPVDQIPLEHRHKPILSVLRNPYDRYVSQYEFKWWVKRPTAFTDNLEALRAAYPRYPDLTFAEFVAVFNSFFLGNANNCFSPEDRLGRHTVQFAQYYFADPARVAIIDAQYLANQQYYHDMHPRLRMIFQEDLNRQLHDFLLEMDYDPAEIAFILDHERVLPPDSTRRAEQSWEHYYTPELKAQVRHYERMLFAMYSQWDV